MIDVGSRPPRMAPTSTSRLALHLHARSLVTWALSFALVGAVLGSLAGSLDDMLSSDAMREFFEKLGGGTVLIDTFIGSEFAILASLAAAYAISAVSRMRSEEVSGHLELLLSAGPDRQRWAAGHLVVALGGGTALLLLAAAPMAATMAAALGGGQHTLDVLAVALASLPAVWLLAAVAVVLVGWLPRVAAGAWVVLVAAVALGEFGEMWHAPAWLRALSPLTHDPTLPVSGSWVLPLIVMTALSLAGVALGLVGLRRRDIPA
jgi:ABC-2 type transport system permease protein